MFIPIPLKERLKANKQFRKSKKKEKIATGVSNNRTVVAKYNRELQSITNEMIAEVNSGLFESIRKLENEYVQDNYAEILGNAILDIGSRWRNITRISKVISAEMVNGLNSKNRQVFYNSLQRATGVSLNGIISEEGLEPLLTSKIPSRPIIAPLV